MSLYLGNIHYWLYNKILWFEELEEAIAQCMEKQQDTAKDWIANVRDEFGEPTGGRPLEEVIDRMNIHGWLQSKITSAELRQAAMVTKFLEWNSVNKAELLRISAEEGKAAAADIDYKTATPEESFNAVNNFILEGMPCDHVNRPVSSTPDEYVWETTTCLHKGYWDQVGGDVENFYEMREAWLKAFVETLNPVFAYEKTGEGLNRIFRK